MRKLFEYLKGDGTRGSSFDRWLLFLGVFFLILGLVVRVFQKFCAIGPESSSFLLPGMFIVAMGAFGRGAARLRGNDAGKKPGKKQGGMYS
jgi:hypothetical protein